MIIPLIYISVNLCKITKIYRNNNITPKEFYPNSLLCKNLHKLLFQRLFYTKPGDFE